MRTTTVVSAAMFVLVACHRRDEISAKRTPGAAPPALTAGSQTDLARELDDAERRGTWTAVKTRWQGQRLRWTVTRQRLLCSSADACHIAPFPIQRPAQHGWLPSLGLAPTEFARLDAACGKADPCELTFEGTLSELVVSGELPTSMRFDDVTIVGAHG